MLRQKTLFWRFHLIDDSWKDTRGSHSHRIIADTMADSDLLRSPTPEAAKPIPRLKKKITSHSGPPLANSKVPSKRGSKDLGDANSLMRSPKSNCLAIQGTNFVRISGINKRFMDSVRSKSTPKISSTIVEETDAPIGTLLPNIKTR